jgi:hypothetical protein
MTQNPHNRGNVGQAAAGKRLYNTPRVLDYELVGQARCSLRRVNENPIFKKVDNRKPKTLCRQSLQTKA